MSKQFIQGICTICGKDHRQVMLQDDIIKQYYWVQECISHTERSTVVNGEFAEADIVYFRKYLEEHSNPQREQLEYNMKCISDCEVKFHNGIGYEWLITINFSEDYDIEQLKDNIEKLLKANYRYLKQGKFVVEFHGKEKNHWHIHVAVKSLLNRRKASIAKQIAKLMGIRQNFVDVRQSYGNPEEYVAGVKTDSKKEQIELDIELRNKLKIKHLYII